MATATLPGIEESRVVLHGVTWESYEKILDALDGCHARLTYDRGVLEIMSPTPEHEYDAQALGVLIRFLADAHELDYQVLGSTTFKRQAAAKGLEPDNCVYFENWPVIATKKRYDLEVDPPPDLAIEIDVTHSPVDRPGIYASLGVPEVWRLREGKLVALIRQPDGSYQERDTSPRFPSISLTEIVELLDGSRAISHRIWHQQVRDWIRVRLEA